MRFFLLVLACWFLSGCERDISFTLDNVTPKLVVEATIENGQPPVVILSTSLSFFDSLSPAQLLASMVTDAEVWVTNGGRSYRLRGYNGAVGAGPSGFYYTNDHTQPAQALVGALDQTYGLLIRWRGNEYRAQTTIPSITRRIDSLFWRPAPAGNAMGKAAVYIRATDKPGYGDYIRYYTRQNNGPFLPGLNSVYDDQVIDGITYEVQVERGIVRTGGQPEEGYNFFDRGDTVTVKVCNIDKGTYDFWRTIEFNYASIGNPFSSPTKAMSNISGPALGYFGGYAAQLRTLVIPR